MDQHKLRKEAIKRYLNGDCVTTICRELRVSRKWFYKWRHRYNTGVSDWYKDQSKTPKRKPRKIDNEIENLVLNIRKKLEETKYAQIGAMAIAWRINQLGGTPPPLWTINRILKRKGKIKSKGKRNKTNNNVKYTWFVEPYYPGHIYQTDLVGPRYLKGDGRFYALSTIDRYSHMVYSVPIRSKDDDSIVCALLKTWQQIGVPEFQQFDNELSFLGSNRYPHSFGKVLQLCLAEGIQPIFIPAGEPWRNGVIERFNSTFDNNFYRTERFENFEHLKEQLMHFISFHNSNHVYSTNHGKTPHQVILEHGTKLNNLAPDLKFSEDQTLPYESYIHFIRFIRSDLNLNIRGETFKMPKKAMYQYVKATICTEWHLLNVFIENENIAQFRYPLPNFNQEDPEINPCLER